MSRLLTLALLITLLVCQETSAASTPAATNNPNWQLVFQYDHQSLKLIRADRIAPVTKHIRTPGLTSAPVRLAYNLDWFDASGQTIYQGGAQLPLGIRSTLGDASPCQQLIPESGVIVIRVAGPSDKSIPLSLNMTRTMTADKLSTGLALPLPFETSSHSFQITTTATNMAPTEGPISYEKIRDTGPDWNRLVLVIMGDGYTAANLSAGQFESAAAGLGSDIEAKSPWDIMFAATNVYRIDIESNEEGADHDPQYTYKDTYLSSSYWVSDIERLLTLTGNGHNRAIAAADAMVGPGVWDIILVLVNSTKYGGSGGSIAVSSVHSAASEIVIHELGHTFGELADEYESEYPGYPIGDFEPNVDFDYDGSGLKWLAWVEASTPLPTPEASPYLSAVGTFEGARYQTTGIYRPWYNCEMRALNRPFCPICKEAHLFELTDQISLLDDISPYPETSHNVGESGVLFTTMPLPFNDLMYEWALDGETIPGEIDASLLLTPDLMATGPQTLTMSLDFNTDLVRLRPISLSYSWTVTASGGQSCCVGIVGDANQSGDPDPTISDISVIIDHLFISGLPLVCYAEADINQSGGSEPTTADITIGDISTLIDHLFISGAPLNDCL